jgi:uncharacterized protein (TIGR00661 family)
MARILYAVYGEGMGHAFRSKVVIDYLLSQKHELKIVAGGRAFHFLSSCYPLVEDIHFFHISYSKNKVQNLKTIYENAKGLPKGSRRSLKKLMKIFRAFQPELLITDHEPFSDLVAKWFNTPVIAIDNINMLIKGKIDVPFRGLWWYVINRLVTRTFIFMAKNYIIPSFFFVPVRGKNVYLVPPILGRKVLKLKPIVRDHVLVYQTAAITEEAVNTLRTIKDQKFVVYGWKKSKSVDNIVFKDFSEDGFLEDLRTAKAVIMNGGFTLMGEAIYLGKPILSIPVQKQFEQMMNAYYLDKQGYGKYLKSFDYVGIKKFLSGLDFYRDNLEQHKQEGNAFFEGLLDEMISKIVGGRKIKLSD